MCFLQLIFNEVYFTYDTMGYSLFENINLHMERGWTGLAGVNGSGKTTLLKLAAGILKPQTGSISGNFNKIIYCSQRTDNADNNCKNFLLNYEKKALRLKSFFQIKQDWLSRWETLSHGERKKAQIAAALWFEPELLILDEPTNHIDYETRKLFELELENYEGIGLLVSHDRKLMNNLCYQTVFLDPPVIVIRPGGITKGKNLEKQEQITARHNKEKYKKELNKLKNEAKRRKKIADSSKKRTSKKGVHKHDNDSKSKIDLAKLSGKDGVGGKLVKQMENRIIKTAEKINNISIKKEFNQGIWITTEYSKKNNLFKIKEGALWLGEEINLEYPDLKMEPKDRISIRGNNGTGKSTLMNFIITKLSIDGSRVISIPQETTLVNSRDLLDKVKKLPGDLLGKIMTIISCLGSRPERLLQSVNPSPGETKKILLAMGILKKPHLIMMDEPTNHMDIESVICLEQVLGECPCGLLLISHDEYFLNSLTKISWRIKPNTKKTTNYQLEIF